MTNHIYPIFNQIIQKKEKETLLNQHAKVIWMTGLSGSGKSTLAIELEKRLFNNQFKTVLLDGDNIRAGINSNLGFSASDRIENIRRIAEIAKLFEQNGMICICCFVSPTNDLREMARKIIGDGFVEVYINAKLEDCEKRDVKGLYKKARAGEILDFTGINAPFDIPLNPEIEINTSNQNFEECSEILFQKILTLVI